MVLNSRSLGKAHDGASLYFMTLQLGNYPLLRTAKTSLRFGEDYGHSGSSTLLLGSVLADNTRSEKRKSQSQQTHFSYNLFYNGRFILGLLVVVHFMFNF